MFHMALHLNSSRPEPDEEPFVFDPECHYIDTLTWTSATELIRGGHATFTLAALGHTLAEESPEAYDLVLALQDLLTDAVAMVKMLCGADGGVHDLEIVEQGIHLTFRFVMGVDAVRVIVIDRTSSLITDHVLRMSSPTETHVAADLIAEVRQVCQAVVDGGFALGTAGIDLPLVHDWCRTIGIRHPGAA